MATKKSVVFVFAAALLVFFTGCVSVPLEGAVRLDFGGTLPPEILEYFSDDQLKDAQAKFIVVQGEVQVCTGDFIPTKSVVNTAIFITVGKEYRIVQMSRYIKPQAMSNGTISPGKYENVQSFEIRPNMATIYSSLQEARMATEMGTY